MHVNDFRAVVPNGDQASQHRLLRVARMAGHLDDEQVMIACEAPGCERSVLAAEVYSLALVYRIPGRGVPAFQCSEEQHFGCSHEHAVAAVAACLRNHIEPALVQLRADHAASS